MTISKQSRFVPVAVAISILSGVMFMTQQAEAAGPSLSVGSVSTMAGAEVELPVKFNPGKTPIASIQFDLTLPSDLTPGAVVSGEMLGSATKSVSNNLIGRTWRFIIFGLNQNVLEKKILLTAHVKVAPGTPAGALKIPVSGIVFVEPNGIAVTGGKSQAGTVTIKLKTESNLSK